MKKLLNKLFFVTEIICKIMMIVQIVCVSIVVAGRYLFNKTPAWGEETTLLCLVWIALLSAAISVREKRHMRVTIIEYIFPKKIIFILELLALVTLGGFALVMILEGAKLTQLTAMSILPGLKIKSSWLYSSVPVSSVILLIAVLEKIYEFFAKRGEIECQ